jgi:hypothetical protein
MKLALRPILCLAGLAAMPVAMAMEPGSASGELRIDDQVIEIRHVYAQRQPKGFYNDNDPTWTLLFSPVAIPLRKLDNHFLDPSLRIGLTLTSTFDDTPTLSVLSQDIYHGQASMSGGKYPELDLQESGPDTFSGRLFLPQPISFFDSTIHYDIAFSVTVIERKARRF